MKKLFLFFCTLWFFCTAFSQQTDYGHWVMADSMNFVTHGASTVLQSGKVLVAGEGAVCELYEYTVDKWVVTDSLSTKRKGRRLLTLQDGRALAISGTTNEIFDETTENWTTSANFNLSARHSGTATLLNDGTVLYAGGMLEGRVTSSCELYDPVADTWTIVDSMNTERIYHAALLLQDGRILVSGGESYNGYLNACEIFDPETQTWFQAAPLNKSRSHHVSLLLPDGRAFILGGDIGEYDQASTRDAEIYKIQENTWFSLDNTLSPGVYINYGSAIHLYDNTFLIINKSVWGIYDTLNFESLFYSYRKLNQKNAMIERLTNGSVLVMGGRTAIGAFIPHSRACEIYHPTSTGIKTKPEKDLQNFTLYQNYPNPFNPQTIISYDLAKPCVVKLAIFNASGQHIKTLINKKQILGEHHILFDASALSSGIYYYRLSTPDFVETRKMVKIE